jgi:hypothetical protein
MKNIRSPWKTAKVACLAAGLVSTWDATSAPAAEYSFSGAITPTHDLSDVFFIFALGPCSPGGGVFSKKIADFLPANTTTPFNITLHSMPGGLGVGSGFTILALYDTVNNGVAVGYDPGQAATILAQSPAPTWDGGFLPGANSFGGGIFYGYIGAGESDVSTDLQSGTYGGISMDDAKTGGPFAPVGSRFPGVSSDPVTSSAFTLIDFSGASNGGGGFVIETVPEPATFSFMAAGAAFLLFGRSRKQTED